MSDVTEDMKRAGARVLYDYQKYGMALAWGENDLEAWRWVTFIYQAMEKAKSDDQSA